MDVLRPPILTIAGRNYRINAGDSQCVQASILASQNQDACINEDHIPMVSEDSEDSRIICNANGCSASLSVPSVMYKFVIGRRGETKQRLEHETRCRIFVPKANEERPLQIKGESKKDVQSAITRIELLVESSRKKLPFTHFVCFPANQESIQLNFKRFQSLVLERYRGERGIDASLFQNTAKLHLTVSILTLLSEADTNKAIQVIQECKSELNCLLSGDCKIQLCGLDYMNDDPTSVTVLYAKITKGPNEEKLQNAADYIANKLAESGMVPRQHDRVKLHVTVMNTAFRLKGAATSPAEAHTVDSFNAKPLLQDSELKNFLFGYLESFELHISQRNATSCDGFYKPIAKLCM